LYEPEVKRVLLTLLPSGHEKQTLSQWFGNDSFFSQRDVNVHPTNEHKKNIMNQDRPRGYGWVAAYARAFFQNILSVI